MPEGTRYRDENGKTRCVVEHVDHISRYGVGGIDFDGNVMGFVSFYHSRHEAQAELDRIAAMSGWAVIEP